MAARQTQIIDLDECQAVVPTRLPLRQGLGIDRLSMSFPAQDWLELDRWDRVSRDREGGWSAQVSVATPGGPSIMVGLRSLPSGVHAKVEANPARFADPGGCSLLPMSRLDEAASVMWSAALQMVRPTALIESAQDCNVRRLDLARDFRGVMSPGLYVDGLEPLSRPYAKRKGVWTDVHTGGAQTLHVGSGAGMVRLYDQHAAYAEKGAPEGSLRWEVEARRGWLETVGVTRLADLDSVSMHRLVEQRWEWSRMGETVTGPVHAADVLLSKVRAGDIKRATAERLMGQLVFGALGRGETSRTTAWRYRETLEAVGVTAEALWTDDLSRQAVGRLDFETGTEFIELTA